MSIRRSSSSNSSSSSSGSSSSSSNSTFYSQQRVIQNDLMCLMSQVCDRYIIIHTHLNQSIMKTNNSYTN